MKLFKLMMILALSVSGMSCMSIPSSYQGKFEDSKNGASMRLKGFEGKLKLPDGTTFELKTEDMNFKNISEGKDKIFLRANSADEKTIEVFWIKPNGATRQAVEGFVWFDADIVYTLLDTRARRKVSEIDIIRCQNGRVQLDTATKNLQVGWPPNCETYNMVRSK